MIVDHYGARRSMMQTDSGDGIYRPAPPDGLYLDKAEWGALLVGRAVVELSPRQPAGQDEFDAGGRPAPDFSVARADPKANVFTAVAARATPETADGQTGTEACWVRAFQIGTTVVVAVSTNN